jgi:hypothetical protein
VLGPSGLIGVITVFREGTGRPQRNELDLVTVYAGHVTSPSAPESPPDDPNLTRSHRLRRS